MPKRRIVEPVARVLDMTAHLLEQLPEYASLTRVRGEWVVEWEDEYDMLDDRDEGVERSDGALVVLGRGKTGHEALARAVRNWTACRARHPMLTDTAQDVP